MKKLFFAPAAFLLLLCSCNPMAKTDSGATSRAESNKANSNTIYRAIETGDVSKVDSLMDVNFTDHTPMGAVKGVDSAKKMLADIHTHFSNLKFETISNATDGDYNFALVRMTGTATDATMGFPANTPIDMMSVDVVKMNSDGKAVDHWGYADPADMMKMMAGQHPAMPATKMAGDSTKK